MSETGAGAEVRAGAAEDAEVRAGAQAGIASAEANPAAKVSDGAQVVGASAVNLDELRAQLSAGAVVTDPDVVATYSVDRALFSPAGKALALVRAETIEDVQATVRFAAKYGIPVVPSGARTGLSGGANAVDGALLLSVAKMNKILKVNTVDQTVTVQPGVINLDLKKHLADFNLSYPPDPGSVAISSIGGNVATNAGGMCCVKYGVTRDFVRSIKVVTADGSLTTVGRPTAKGVAGFELSHLFIGSEGTLGVIVEITLRVVPKLPDPLTAVALFAKPRDAARTVTEFMATGVTPSMMEYLDGSSIAAINDFGDFGLPADAGAMLLVQSDGSGSLEAAERDLQTFQQTAEACGATEVIYSDDPADSEALVAARRVVGHAMEKVSHALGGGSLVDDVCVPRSKLADFFDALEAIAVKFPELHFSAVGHLGDGNMHPNVLFDARDAQSSERAQEAFGAIMQAGLDLGGTITGEHGVGYLKAGWLARELDSTSTAMHLAIKQALDPQGIMNPGKMLSGLK